MRSKTPLILSGRKLSDKTAHDRAIDITAHSRDLATGDLKTLTAKRELPQRLERRPSETLLETMPTPHSYMFALVIWACAVAMLISGGIVLFVMVQP